MCITILIQTREWREIARAFKATQMTIILEQNNVYHLLRLQSDQM